MTGDRTDTSKSDLVFATMDERPDLEEARFALVKRSWPRFVGQNEAVNRDWDTLFAIHRGLQFVAYDKRTELVVGTGNVVPFSWSGEADDLPGGVDAVLEKGLRDHAANLRPTALSALQAVVDEAYRGRGLSRCIVEFMRGLAQKLGLRHLVAPVRPNRKSSYPTIAMKRYIGWMRADGLPFDPWLRVHRRLGAEILRIAEQSMVVEGRVSEWEEWTGMEFPETGAYVVPGALELVSIDRERDVGRYEEPNVWMHHSVD